MCPGAAHESFAQEVREIKRVSQCERIVRFKVDIELATGSHVSEAAITKQLNDKERIAAALENPNLLEMVQTCLQPTEELLLNM